MTDAKGELFARLALIWDEPGMHPGTGFERPISNSLLEVQRDERR
jgi:hypothetical protein